MNKVRILCVGIGGYANVYLEALLKRDCADFEIAGMVDIAPQGCKYFAQLRDMGVPLYSDMEAFYVEHEADLAIITTPIHLHTRQILCALEHHSHVLCEKPLSGCSADAERILQASQAADRFVMIGYQWSYSEAILRLKADILAKRYGNAVFCKSMVLWPRPKDYFTRGSGWGGKRTAPDGTIINDSVLNNATAHYIHNILYVLGDTLESSAHATVTDCTLLRANDIENFDTVCLHFKTEGGCRGLYLASHATEKLLDPIFEYRFENGSVCFSEQTRRIIGTLADGTVIDYGDPFEDINRKVWMAIDNVKNETWNVPCGVVAAAEQVRLVEAAQAYPIHTVAADARGTRDAFIFVKGLHEEMLRCYRDECPRFSAECMKEWVEDAQ